jgi:hypothetical protein
MSAHLHPRPVHPGGGPAETRVRWWAVALPAAAFAVLLLLIAGPTDAHAVSGSGAVEHLLGLVRQVPAHLAP